MPDTIKDITEYEAHSILLNILLEKNVNQTRINNKHQKQVFIFFLNNIKNLNGVRSNQ